MIAIIPARGGSKGLPGKNVRPLAGVPLIYHTIRAAMEAASISRVIISTDDVEIAEAARACGAEVPFMRPAELARDDSMVMDTYLYTVDRIAEERKRPIEAFVALLPTVPLRSVDDIDGAVELFKSKRVDSVISVTEAPVPVQWYRKIDEKGVLCEYSSGFDAVLNRQELEPTYIPNGAVYVFRTERLRATRQYYMEQTYPFLMPRERSADIDELLDFEWAEFLLSR